MKATIETVTFYEVVSNTDLTEGRGGRVVVGRFLDRDVAEIAAKGNYVMGSDCPIEKKTWRVAHLENGERFLLGERIDVAFQSREDLRRISLSKLSAAERAALGV